MSSPRVALPGSDRHELRPHTAHPACHPDERHDVSVITCANLTEDEFSLLSSFANEHGLVVVSHDRLRRRVLLSGRTPNLESAFGVSLHHREHDGGTFCCHYGPVTVPADLSSLVEGVFGLDNRPAAKPHYRKLALRERWLAGSRAHAAVVRDRMIADPSDGRSDETHLLAREAEAKAFKKPPGTFTPLELAKLYNFPPGDGHGQCIALIELGGGFKSKDFQAYAAELGLHAFTVHSVSVDGGRNQTGSDADGEVMLDIEVAAAIAPAAKIVCYFAPNTDRGFIDAISAAVHDQYNNVSIISISWGGPESSWTSAAINSMDKVFAEAVAKGITVLVAAGDNGSDDGVGDGKPHADFPASSPNVCGVGGTTLRVNGTTLNESVWNEVAIGEGAGGGAFSTHFPVPTWQAKSQSFSLSRGVPDVAANADPETGYLTIVDGRHEITGGTSAGAPLLAGLVARINQRTGKRLGHVCPTAYARPSVCRDITAGSNGAFRAVPGWDATSGLGVIDGAKLAAALG